MELQKNFGNNPKLVKLNTAIILYIFYIRYLAVHEMVQKLGLRKAVVLVLFHALTGCDTVEAFFGKGKKTFWDAWTAFPELTQALQNILDDVSCLEKEFRC